MKIFIWKRDVPLRIESAHAGGVIVIADDLTHAHGLLCRDKRLSHKINVFDNKPDVIVEVGETPCKVILLVN